ncbi:SpoVR family protein [Herbivorax sp. ANBcel31]|uniref:SpoVR family protein n=1 Tax=Herbivorax sp. ANBcel31 TaxID=3069754 RepID=UPI0027B6B391|nr:SpoVR family protein [Herbivorax sp. ANBcel31]MDQ2085494.1 SpoVR family protein [Herbivorax sp. ANBcel31]
MSEYSIKELLEWNEKIENIVFEEGLNCYEQEFEICSYEDMIGYETYVGMPSHYPHWSYGKQYERKKTLHRYNLTGLPYEMVINSDPCIAYLMKDNTLLLQILTIAHVYGHNDFFKNNRLFKQATRAKDTVEMFKNHANRIREYIQDPGIGYSKVEKILNAAHAIKFHIYRNIGEKLLSEEQKKNALLERFRKPKSEYPILEPKPVKEETPPDFKKIPIEPQEDILLFIMDYGKLLDWEKDILNIVREETIYFIPQIETKIMNEGWASYWHYNILKKLNLSQELHLEFLKRHNQVIKPHLGQINPYYMGFKIIENIKSKYADNPKKIFEVREVERDQSFIRRYLTKELCEEMNLFEYMKLGKNYVVTEVADQEGWKTIRDAIASNTGLAGVPVIKVLEWVQKDNMLILEHQYDGRELELSFAYETLKHISDLWEGKVMLVTKLDNRRKFITCDEQKRVRLTDG